MSRDHGVRNRIIEYLTANGTVVHTGGKATSNLKKAIGYEGTDAGFTQIVSSMDKGGLVRREIRGKRTYRISKGATIESSDSGLVIGSISEGPVDYDELAAILLTRAIRGASPLEGSEPPSWARRRLDQLEGRNAVLQQDLVRVNAVAETLVVERDVLVSELEAAEHNLSLLTDRLQGPRRPQGGGAERLGPDEQTLLHQLRQRRPARMKSSERAI
jgi:hypothetical protein